MKAWKLWAVALGLLAVGVVFDVALLRFVGTVGVLITLFYLTARTTKG